MMLHDPPELRQMEAASRFYMTEEDYPGVKIGSQLLMAASLNPKDWFRYRHREQAAIESWSEHYDSRERRRNLYSGYEFDQILIIGSYGQRKSSLAVLEVDNWFSLGHPAFSQAAALIGWRLQGEEMYTAKGAYPTDAIELIDESSAWLERRMGPGVAVSSFSSDNLNTRKINSKSIHTTAHDWEVPQSIRNEVREVWMPLKQEQIHEEFDDAEPVDNMRPDPANDPARFTIVWYIWTDYPYRKGNLIEGGVGNNPKKGFGPPDAIMYDQGYNVRRAYLLNDTWELAKTAFSSVADRETIKDNLRRRHGIETTERTPPPNPLEAKLRAYFESRELDPPDFYEPGELADALGVDPRTAGTVVRKIIPGLTRKQKEGYSGEYIHRRLQEMVSG